MHQHPTATETKKAAFLRKSRGKFRIHAPGNCEGTGPPGMEEKLIQNAANGIPGGYKLQNLADTVRIEVVHVPANNLLRLVYKKRFTQFSMQLFLDGLLL